MSEGVLPCELARERRAARLDLPRRISGDVRGGVYVEFLVAFLPLLLFYGALMQLALLAVGGLMVEHSAVLGARAASWSCPTIRASTPELS